MKTALGYRIVSLIKKLYKLGIKSIYADICYNFVYVGKLL